MIQKTGGDLISSESMSKPWLNIPVDALLMRRSRRIRLGNGNETEPPGPFPAYTPPFRTVVGFKRVTSTANFMTAIIVVGRNDAAWNYKKRAGAGSLNFR